MKKHSLKDKPNNGNEDKGAYPRDCPWSLDEAGVNAEALFRLKNTMHVNLSRVASLYLLAQ
jgi:hypothetical protein